MFHLRPKVFRDPDLIRGVEMFDMLDGMDVQAYNLLLLEDGRTVQVTGTKTWGVTGTPAKTLEDGGYQEAKPDAYYVMVEYKRQPNSPYEPSFGRLEAARERMRTLEIEAHEPPAETPAEPPPPTSPDDIVIDITAEQQRAKKTRARKPGSKRKPRRPKE